jgi:hypothetical protein
MINNVLINGVQVTGDRIFLSKLGSIVNPNIDITTYQRGGSAGQILSHPLYRGFTINLNFTVIGITTNDFITQRERFISYFQNNPTEMKTLGFELANGVTKQIDCYFSGVSGDLEPDNILHSIFTVTAVSEKEFFESGISLDNTMVLFTLGGGAIPMGIPMGMATAPTGEISLLTNAGNAPTFPSFRVYAPFTTSFTLSNDTTDSDLSYTGALTSSDYVDLDFYNHTAIKNGTTNVLDKISGVWWTLDPGDNSVKVTGDSDDTGYAVITYRDSYRNL